MKEQQYEMLQYHYDCLDKFLQDVCVDLPFHLDGPEYDAYCYMILHPVKMDLQHEMLKAAEDEDFEKALAYQRFIQNRLSRY